MNELELVNANVDKTVDVHLNIDGETMVSIRGQLLRLTDKVYQIKCYAVSECAVVTFLGSRVVRAEQLENMIEIFLK